MNAMKLGMAAALMLACGAACADGSGTITYQGKTFQLKGAYAYLQSDPFDKSKPATMVVLGERPVDAKKIDAAEDRDDALAAAFDRYTGGEERPAKLEIVVSRTQPPEVAMISFTVPGTSLSASGKKAKLELKRNDDKRIEGTLRSMKDSDKNDAHGGYFDVSFALDVAP